jgi:hypothetical protein
VRTALVSGALSDWRGIALSCLIACASGPSPAPPTPLLGAVIMQVGPGPSAGVDDASKCDAVPVLSSITMGWLGQSIGTTGVDDDAQATCIVHRDGDTFDVSGVVSLDAGESFSVAGQLTPDAGTLRATFQLGGVSYVSQGGCIVTSSAAYAASDSMTGLIECPEVTDGRGHTCFASAQFAFADCSH